MHESLVRPRLSLGQRVLAAVLGLLIITVQVMLAQAYRNLGSTTTAFGTATDTTTGLTRLQREVLRLALEVEQARSRDDLDLLDVRRGLVGKQLEVTASAVPPRSSQAGALRVAMRGLDAFDAELAHLRAHPTATQLARSRPVMRRDLDDVETVLKEAYDASEISFFGSVSNALRARTNLERVLMGASGLTLAVALMLGLSLRRRASRAFARAYRLLVEEVEEREAAEQALRHSEQRFRALVHHASDVFTVVGDDGIIRYQSPAVEQVLDHPAEELIGRPLLDLVHPDDRELVSGLFAESRRRHGSPVVGEVRMLARDAGEAARRFEMTVTDLLDDPTVQGLVLNYRDITERALYQERLTQQAYHDPLTGLVNCARFSERLEQALRQRGNMIGLLFVDLDRFKLVNDSLGHEAGDQLLRDVAKRLSSSLREGDTLARLGGDEFTVLLPRIKGEETAIEVAERLHAQLEQPFEVLGQPVVVSASIGIATGVAMHDLPEELLRDADSAMYEAKARGRGRHEVFRIAMHTRAVSLLAMETDLRRAVDAGGLELHYQPIVRLRSERIAGVEALVRWRRSDGSLMLPAEFIPVAEETGLIHQIGRWVLRQACQQLASWRASLPQAAGLSMSVNVSGRQLQDPSLTADVAAALEDAGIDPGSLTLELTESVVAINLEAVTQVLQALRWMSVQLAMDDFGTGYSSLSSLSQLSMDILKIDRSFVARLDRDAEGHAVVYAIISLANALGMRVTGEGIETPAQLETLTAMGCHYGQGNLLGLAVPADELAEMLKTRNVHPAASKGP
jgi:diguanylate cyclase (GGDEF)-like protein/PAS domain S-box-containing protein